ncbi:MAG: metallophosphoesterase [Gemmatales bacterium]|nr:metallophosphoesterase [Gemmatales bacterium]MDW7993147.1 metallophosphoesterase [Gemmatales bacterium]
MLVGVISDTHGNQSAVAKALRLLASRKVECIIHCGDIDDVATLHMFAGTKLHLVFGNCDPPTLQLDEIAHALGLQFHGRLGQLELGGARIAFMHGDDRHRLDYLVRSGAYDFVFHGHTHQRRCVQVGATWVVNPGALARVAVPTIALVDLPSQQVEFLDVPAPSG